jgi:hypothetical protein
MNLLPLALRLFLLAFVAVFCNRVFQSALGVFKSPSCSVGVHMASSTLVTSADDCIMSIGHKDGVDMGVGFKMES